MSAPKRLDHLIGETLREVGLLLGAFAPLERVLGGHGGPYAMWCFLFVGVTLVGVGMWLELRK